MANEIVSRSAAEQARVELETGERDLSSVPGRYFRALEDIPERVETAMRDVDRWSGRDHTVGKEEVSYRARRAVLGGTVLLAVRLHYVDDVFHSVELAAHPADSDRSNLAFMADEFFTLFVADGEGEKIREAEIAEVHARIADVQHRLAAPPAASAALPLPGQHRPTTAALVRALDHKEDIAGKARAIAAVAEERRLFIEQGAKEITEHTSLLANFYHEKATAALAQVGDSIQFAKDISEGLTTLSLYTGEGVTVETLCEGESADPSEPLTLYQDRLYLDEELAVESLTGGFDFSGLKDLGAILATDRGLLDRMVPASRGAVLVRVRRGNKRYFDDPSAALVEAFMNQRNQKVYLLVRDGANVHLVNSEITTDSAERLFPTRKEIADIFKNWGREIRPDHLDYSRARTALEKSTVFYKRMLLMLWGLNDRLGLFGGFYDKQRWDNWYDADFQAERIVYVYDGEGTLGVHRPSFFDWIRESNRHMQAGSRVAAVWGRMINVSSAPACFSSRAINFVNGEADPIYKPLATAGIARTERMGDRLTVKCAVGGRMRTGEGKRREFEARIDLAHALRHEGSTSCLCLDRVTVSDLDYYLNSRKERRSYEDYLYLFKIARAFLAEEESAQRDAVASLRQDLAHAGIKKGIADSALGRAIALWRAQNGSRLVWGEGWTDGDRDTVLDIAYALSGKQADLLDRARKDIAGCVPVEIRVDGRGAFWLYREPREDEVSWMQAEIGPGYVMRVQLRIGRDRVSETGKARHVHLTVPDFDPAAYQRHRLPPLPVREETAVADEALSAAWKQTRMPGYLPHSDLLAVEKAVSHEAPAAMSAVAASSIDAKVRQAISDDRSGQVARTSFLVALGAVAYRFNGEEAVRLLCLEGNGLDVLAASGPEGAEMARKIVDCYYKEPEARLKMIAHVIEKHKDGALPLWLSLGEAGLAATLADGCQTVHSKDADTYRLEVASRPAFLSMEPRKLHGSIAEAVHSTYSRNRNDSLADVKVVWRNEANRQLAEAYFARELAAAAAQP